MSQTLLFIIGVIVALMIFVYFVQRAQMQKVIDGGKEIEKRGIRLDVIQGIKFGFGFAIGAFLWGVVVFFLSWLIFAPLVVGFFKSLSNPFAGGFFGF